MFNSHIGSFLFSHVRLKGINHFIVLILYSSIPLKLNMMMNKCVILT